MRKILLIALLVSAIPCAATKKSSSVYESLLAPLDLYSIPKEAGKAMPIKDFFLLVAKRGLAIKIAKQDLNIADQAFQLTYDAYNLPTTVASAAYSNAQSYTPGAGTYTKASTLGLGLSGDSGWGLSYSLDLPKITTTVSSSPGYSYESDTSSIGASVTFNLLKNSIFFLGRNRKNEADVAFDAAKLSMRTTALSTLLTAQTAYFTLMLKEANLKVLEFSVRSAKALLSDVNEMFNSGEGDKLSTVKVQLQVAQAETDLLTAKAALGTAQQDLKNVLAAADESIPPYPDPSEMKRIPELADLTIPQAIEKAKKQRPDYLSAILAKQRAGLDVDAAFAARLPQLDLTTSYGWTGTQDNISAAVKESTGFTHPQYSVGLTFSYSFFNDSAKTSYRTSQISLLKTDLAIDQLNHQITKEITSAILNVQIGAQRLKTSELARSLSEKKLQAEFEKFRLGESNIRNVIDFQSEMNSTRLTEIGARIDLLLNFAALRNAMGELPQGIVVE